MTEMGFTGTPLTNAILSQSGANGNIININGTENSAKEQLRAVGIDSNPVKSTNLGLGRGKVIQK